MVLPSLNLHCAVAGGLGRFAFCCGVASCCAKARQLAMRIKATEIAARFFKMIFFKVFLLRNVRIIIMSVYEEKREELERYEFMMGKARGRLAVSLDSLTRAAICCFSPMVLAGSYLVSRRNMASWVRSMSPSATAAIIFFAVASIFSMASVK